ncbi:MAG: cadherin-like beta sandwich domain-containing protein [Clostridia bacterium]|nr:cadherin-like beta sandwich domain-containing protein [Clostridia bacterium]
MKKLCCILLALMLTAVPAVLPVSAAGSATVTANASTVTVGKTVTVTAKFSNATGIGSMDAMFYYNPKTFEYVSCGGATANGGGGNVKVSYVCYEVNAPKSLTVTIKLKAVAPGAGDFKWTTEGFYDDAETLLGTPSKSLSVSATNPTLSGDATLSYLRPSKGTLTPAFSKNVTSYTVSVPYTVTRGLLNYSANDPNARTEITQNADLAVGKTTRVITVTAPNGTVKKYTVVFTREAQQSTTGGDPTSSTEAPPADDALEVLLEGKNMVIADARPDAKLPAGFEWDTAAVNGVEVPAAKQAASGLTLLYLLPTEEDGKGAFYIYDTVSEDLKPFLQITDKKAVYTIHDLTDTETGPEGTVPGTVPVGERTVTAYVYEDPDLADYAILQLTNPKGETGLYTYDLAEGTVQRYHAATIEVEQPAPQTPAETKPAKNAFVTFIEQYQQVILICAAAAVAVAILIIVVVLVIRMCNGGGKGKH